MDGAPGRTGTTRGLATLLTLALVLRFAGDAKAECNSGICVGGGASCTVQDGTYAIDDGCTLNWPTKNVTIAAHAILTSAASAGSFTINAASVTHYGRMTSGGGTITIETSGPFTSQDLPGANDLKGLLDLSSPNDAGGDLIITALNTVTSKGDVTLDGDVTTSAGAVMAASSRSPPTATCG